MATFEAPPSSGAMQPAAKPGPSNDQGLEAFSRLLLASAGREAFADGGEEAMKAEARAAFATLSTKPPRSCRVAWRQATRPSPDGAHPLSVLEILNDDMPFLLDSVVGEIQARGLTLHRVLHPIFKTARRDDGQLVAVTGGGDRNWSDGHQESYIALYLDPLPADQRQSLADAISAILGEVRVAVADWRAMLSRVKQAIADLAAAPRDLLGESIAFLEWLADDQFTFLGAREYRLVGEANTGELVAVDGRGLGLLRDPAVQVLRRGTELVAMTPEVRRFFNEPQPIIITKANVTSRVHRRVHMDYIGVKLYGAAGQPSGELRVVGLLTSSAYTKSPRQIPILRHKVDAVIARSGAVPESHDGKALLNVIETFPRDELFQIGVDELADWSAGILDLELRPRVRVFARRDRFDRFVSVLVYTPRDRFSTAVRERIGAMLAERYRGSIAAFYPHFTDGPLVRVHFIVARIEGPTPEVPIPELEAGVRGIVETWADRLTLLLGATARSDTDSLRARYARAFPAAYSDTFPPERAIQDIERIERLSAERPVGVDFYPDAPEVPDCVRVAIYRLDGPMRLSERVPVLENLGFTVVDERTYDLEPRAGPGHQRVVLHDMLLEFAHGSPLELDRDGLRLEDAFLAVWRGATENDAFNRLVIAAGLEWRQAALLRAFAAYLRQLGSPFGLRYVADTLTAHAGIARDLVQLFAARLDPDRAPDVRQNRAGESRAAIETALGSVQSLDEDRILRQLTTLVMATARTNYFRRDASGAPPNTIALKFIGHELTMAPEPRTYREIWVWSPRVEAVHLRFAPIARGGIRWSDRPLDFRTEVLGLAKAQQVKNSVIVPAGAKGGFIPKLLGRFRTRDDIQKEGIAAYTTFVSAMLDITDDIRDGAIVPPERVVRLDGDDPYLVVAADKGTATFSDTANALSLARGYWLGDAFASGGSAGYDHKRLAITSRGAWECIKRHFREMDRDIQADPFIVVGVGDMSGDVFGNGMLLSHQIRLIAAFDHRDIFLDPDPDPEATWIERKRLFDLPRSSWADFDRSKLSKGGGVYSRSLKSIELSEEVQRLLRLAAPSVTPVELTQAILRAEADLLFFGGIGTFIRASSETDLDAGDRGNDAVRITAAEVRAKVIGEGANLGVTQRARIEYAVRGGRINTDFIDNSAGVNTSDQEVNIKIALRPAVQTGRLALDDRNRLLGEMAGEVARAVLRNNYQQSLALSLAERRAVADMASNARLIRSLEARGLLERRLEAIPSDREISERHRAGRGLTRPELAVLLSYAKISLLRDLLASPVPDDPFLRFLLVDYFPPELQKAFPQEIAQHRLGREIVATTLTNGLVNRLGAATPLRLADETARPITNTAYGFIAARAVYGLAEIWRQIDLLDGRINGDVQLDLYQRTRDLAVHATGRFLRIPEVLGDLTGTIARHTEGLRTIRSAFADIAPASLISRRQVTQSSLAANCVPPEVAAEMAWLDVAADAPAAIEAASASGRPVTEAARVFLAIGDRLRIDAILPRTHSIAATDEYDRLAIAGAAASIADARQSITLSALAELSGPAALDQWVSRRQQRVDRAMREIDVIAGTGELTVARLAVASARLAELARDGTPP